MVLFVEGKMKSFGRADLGEVVKMASVRERAERTLAENVLQIDNSRHGLWLAVSEMAEINHDWCQGGVRLVGADDLTTSVLVILDCPQEHLVLAAHLDGSATEDFLDEASHVLMMNRAKRSMVSRRTCERGMSAINVVVSLLGGFCDDSDYTESLVTTLIKIMSERYDHIHFHLDICCIWILNNKLEREFNYPIHQGAVFDVSRRKLFPAKYDSSAKGPLYILRNTRFNADPNIYKIYNSESMFLEIFPFDYKARDRQKYYKSLSLSSDFMLRRFSTSPRQEQLGFESNIRQVFTLMSEHPDPLKTIFKSSFEPLRFKCDINSGDWIQM